MPYIHMSTSKRLSDEQKDSIAAALGRQITMIPGKSERSLMVDITDGGTLYFSGTKGEFAYVDVEIYGTADFEVQKQFREAVFETMEACGGLDAGKVYVTIHENAHWGLNGSMK